jgi:hypothetical protein
LEKREKKKEKKGERRKKKKRRKEEEEGREKTEGRVTNREEKMKSFHSSFFLGYVW